MFVMNSAKKQWGMVTLLFSTATAAYICRVNISTAAPLLMKEFGMDQIAMGRVFSSFILGYALFQIPSGILADKWGTRKVLSQAVWFWAGLTIMQACTGWGPFGWTASGALGMLMLGRFLLGISASPTYPASVRGVSKWITPAFQGRANGWVIASIGLGSALAPPFVSQIMVRWGWRSALLATAMPVVIIGFIWKRYHEPSPWEGGGVEKEMPSKPFVKSRKNINSRGFKLLTLSYSLQGYVGYIFISWFYLYLVQVRHFGLLNGAWVSSLPWVLSIISIPLGGYVSDRLSAGRLGFKWGRRMVPMAGLALSGILISIGAHTNSGMVAALSLALATAFVLCVEGPFWTVMTQYAGNASGKAGGVMNMGSNLGGFLSPILTPWLAEKIGWENALHVAGILAIIGAFLWLGIKPSPNDPTSPAVLHP
jgi:MFS transporter, ACS family, glucarate transporter